MWSKRGNLWIIAGSMVLLVVANLVGPAAWAAPVNGSMAQSTPCGTVPCRTPTPAPTRVPLEPTAVPATPAPTSSSGGGTGTVTPSGQPSLAPGSAGGRVLLPAGGDGPDNELSLAAVFGLGLLMAAWAIRQRTIGRAK
jgi:hypothetical protein